MEFRPMRRFKQQLPDQECEAIFMCIEHMTGKQVKEN